MRRLLPWFRALVIPLGGWFPWVLPIEGRNHVFGLREAEIRGPYADEDEHVLFQITLTMSKADRTMHAGTTLGWGWDADHPVRPWLHRTEGPRNGLITGWTTSLLGLFWGVRYLIRQPEVP